MGLAAIRAHTPDVARMPLVGIPGASDQTPPVLRAGVAAAIQTHIRTGEFGEPHPGNPRPGSVTPMRAQRFDSKTAYSFRWVVPDTRFGLTHTEVHLYLAEFRDAGNPVEPGHPIRIPPELTEWAHDQLRAAAKLPT